MSDVTFLFDGWAPVARVALIATGGYLTLLAFLRLSGQRTLAQMTGFDFVIAVTVGSAFGRVITAREVSLVEVVATFAVLVGLQWLAAWARESSPWVNRAITGAPALLYHDGSFQQAAMRRHRITADDVFAAVREKGLGSLGEVQAVVFEQDGRFAVLTPDKLGDAGALRRVGGD